MESWLVGGSPECDVVIDRPTVSAHHCRLVRGEGGQFVLEDLQSTNGTFVNGARITGKVSVRPSDVIMLGRGVKLDWPQTTTASSVRREITIGGADDNDIVIDYPMISARHARLVLSDGGVELEDLGSTNGTYIGTRSNRITRAPLLPTDTVFLGSYRIPSQRLLAAIPAEASKTSLTLQVDYSSVILGRGDDCDEVLTHPMVSNRHACVRRLGDQVVVEDLGSTNGTYVNGVKITGPTQVQPGDVIRIATYAFKLKAGGLVEEREHRGYTSIEAREVSVQVGKQLLLANVSLVIFPSEFVGLMGPSGAGKSLFLSALNGYLRPSRGRVLFRGIDLHANYGLFRGQIGYVPQDDIIHPALTVRQALFFAARLRLPVDFSDAEIHDRINALLTQLGLAASADVLIGSPEKRGISGGQRKRVNLAMELITDPSVLFLDEPTSGLSSEDTLKVIRLLREMANTGKTILLTIHQPSLEAFKCLDNLALIAKDSGSSQPGRLAYYGPAYPDSMDFFNPGKTRDNSQLLSPDVVLAGLASRSADDWVADFQRSKHHSEFVQQRSKTDPTDVRSPAESETENSGSILWKQFITLSRRGSAIKLRDTLNTALMILQAPVIAILIVLVFGKQASLSAPADWSDMARATATTLFLLALSSLWFGCSNAAREIVGEWAVYRRERMVNLSIPCYMASKFAVLGAFCVIQCSLLLGIVYWGSGLEGSWLWMWTILFLASFIGVGIGLAVSAVVRSSEAAVGMLPLVILPMVILGGILQPVHDMNRASQLLAQLMPSRWTFEALLLAEAEYKPKLKVPDQAASAEMPAVASEAQHASRRHDIAESFFPEQSERMGGRAAALALGLTLVVCIAGVAAILRSRDIH